MDFLEHYVVSKREDFSDGWSMIVPSVNYAMAIARIGEEESENGPSGFEMQML